MQSTRRKLAAGVATVFLAMTTLSGVSQAQDAPSDEATEMSPELRAMVEGLNPDIRITSVGEWDRVIDTLTQTSWRVHDAAAQEPDEGDQLLTAMWDKYILAADAKPRLDELRERARRESDAQDDKALQKTIAAAAPLVAEQKFRFVTVLTVIFQLANFEAHRSTLQPWLERASETERADADRLFAAGKEEVLSRVDALIRSDDHSALTVLSLASAGRESRLKLNDLRLRLVKAQAALPNPVTVEPRANLAACPPPAQSTSSREIPAIDAAKFPSSEKHYPQKEKAADIQGAPVVRASVSDTGCVLKVEIASTSGSAALDSAALNLALLGRYLPALKDGKAAPGTLLFRVKFELR